MSSKENLGDYIYNLELEKIFPNQEKYYRHYKKKFMQNILILTNTDRKKRNAD